MTKITKNELHMQFTRGMLQLDQMSEYVVPVLDFPFTDAVDRLFALRIRLDRENGDADKSNYRPNWIPHRALNDFLQFLVPAISHPFVRNSLEDSPRLPRSQRFFSPRPALGIPQSADARRVDPIPADLLRQIVSFWFEVVVLDAYTYFTDGERGKQYVQTGIAEIKQSIQDTQIGWQYRSIDQLWEQRRQHTIGYRALRSLLASQFVTAQRHLDMRIDSEPLNWRLAREHDGLVPVSRCFQSDHGAYYAYTLNLTLRDMPGRQQPLLYLMPRLRRYMSQEVTWTGNDDVRVMVEYPSPVLTQLPNLDELPIIQLPVRIKYVKGDYVYRGYITELWQRLIGNSESNPALVDARELIQSPDTYIKSDPEWQNASYHMIYNTGMKPEPRNIDAGLPIDYIRAIHHAATSGLEEWVQAEPPLPITKHVLTEDDIRRDELRSLMNTDLVRRSNKGFKIWTARQPAKKRSEWPEEIQDRFRLALDGKPLTMLLFADKENALDAIEFDVRGVLAVLSGEEELPAGIAIQRIKTPNAFVPLIQNISENDWRADVRKIQAALRELQNTNGEPVLLDNNRAYIAIVQRPEEPANRDWKRRQQDDQKKSALRAAFGSLGIHSQMIRHFPDDDDRGLQVRVHNPGVKNIRPRLLNAVTNALITSTGFTYGPPAEHYAELLGFESELAQNIVVEYWVRYRVTKKPKADFIAVVRQYATGYIEIILPDPKTGNPQAPRSVNEASCYLQTLFARGREKDRIYTQYNGSDVPDKRVIIFFKAQLYGRDQPTLIVPQVGDWRSRQTAWFHDDTIVHGEVTVEGLTLDADALQNVRIVKMLTDEQHNLRYWLDKDNPDNTDALLAVRDKLATVPTIYSIDSREEDGEKSNIETLEQRGRVIELAALMMQPNDDMKRQYAWCQIPHLSRFHPGWNLAATVYPYPCHVMRSLVQDALWAVFEKKRG